MLSAHQPYHRYPDLIRDAARDCNATAQFAGGVPAMCDGVTQGQPGMELSLFSRDVIAMSTAIALSHNSFDAALYLGICDKIVPGLLIGALQFGHLPAIFVPSGPMASGLPNSEKARIRNLYAEGKASREELLQAECDSYHSAGTCTFYGTANSNQMLMEFMGLHMPGAAFVPPDTDLRDALTHAATAQAAALSSYGTQPCALADIIDEKAVVNGMIGLLATGGSTNHTLHLPAIARAAGILIDWQDFDDLSKIIPLLAKVYPNGQADVNHFHAAGGISFVIGTLLDNGLLHDDVQTVFGQGLQRLSPRAGFAERQIVGAMAPTKAATRIFLPIAAMLLMPKAAFGCSTAIWDVPLLKCRRSPMRIALSKHRPAFSMTKMPCKKPSKPANWTRTPLSFCVFKARPPMACRNCTS